MKKYARTIYVGLFQPYKNGGHLYLLIILALVLTGAFTFASIASADATGFPHDHDGESEAAFDVLEPLPTTPSRGALGILRRSEEHTSELQSH